LLFRRLRELKLARIPSPSIAIIMYTYFEERVIGSLFKVWIE
jgi:hypothetical protein